MFLRKSDYVSTFRRWKFCSVNVALDLYNTAFWRAVDKNYRRGLCYALDSSFVGLGKAHIGVPKVWPTLKGAKGSGGASVSLNGYVLENFVVYLKWKFVALYGTLCGRFHEQ